MTSQYSTVQHVAGCHVFPSPSLSQNGPDWCFGSTVQYCSMRQSTGRRSKDQTTFSSSSVSGCVCDSKAEETQRLYGKTQCRIHHCVLSLNTFALFVDGRVCLSRYLALALSRRRLVVAFLVSSSEICDLSLIQFWNTGRRGGMDGNRQRARER